LKEKQKKGQEKEELKKGGNPGKAPDAEVQK